MYMKKQQILQFRNFSTKSAWSNPSPLAEINKSSKSRIPDPPKSLNRFRKSHILMLLNKQSEVNKESSYHIPIDSVVQRQMRSHKNIGSTDRMFINEHVYSIIRHNQYLDQISRNQENKTSIKKKEDNNSISIHIPDWKDKLDALQSLNFYEQQNNRSLPDHVRLSMNEDLQFLLRSCQGDKMTEKLCTVLNERAPMCIRINPRMITRQEMINKFRNELNVNCCPLEDTKYGIHIENTSINLYDTSYFRNGFYEIQDESSQLVSEYLSQFLYPKVRYLDQCAGAGGKTLAVAHKLIESKVDVHDVRQKILMKCKQRFKRNKIRNYQMFQPENENKMFKEQQDVILLDLPCSGTGTIRRNPDFKNNFNKENLQQIVQLQKDIFEKAIKLLNKNGTIIYSTCSILPQENTNQINQFIEKYNLKVHNNKFIQIFPKTNKGDGFFACALQFK